MEEERKQQREVEAVRQLELAEREREAKVEERRIKQHEKEKRKAKVLLLFALCSLLSALCSLLLCFQLSLRALCVLTGFTLLLPAAHQQSHFSGRRGQQAQRQAPSESRGSKDQASR
jgi:Flp pilus assembly protein TadB